jgi:hypothetical protein
MTTFSLNPLSASRQCFDTNQLSAVVKNVLNCFDYLLPAIGKRRVRIVYDPILEQRELIQNQNFHSSINNIPDGGDPDLAKKWYIYTMNRSELPSMEAIVHADVRPLVGDGVLSGDINEELTQNASHWLSFGGGIVHESRDLRVTAGATGTVEIKNAHDIASVMPLLPRYEASPKHRQEAYWENGERVSPMPLTHGDAQSLLLVSCEHGNDRWAYHESKRKCYCFKATDVQQGLFHGYEVEMEEVPVVVTARLRDLGLM